MENECALYMTIIFPLLQLVLNNREEDFNVTQQGTIKKLLPNGLAEVEVTRRSACGHDCAKCGGCGGLETQTLYVTARNHAHASVGDRVLLEGETKQVLGFAVLVYLLPLVLFFVGYGVGAGNETWRRTVRAHRRRAVHRRHSGGDVVQP